MTVKNVDLINGKVVTDLSSFIKQHFNHLDLIIKPSAELEYVPLCMHYWFDRKNPQARSYLLFGDDSGSVHLFQFLKPTKGLFEAPSKKQEGSLKIYMKVRALSMV